MDEIISLNPATLEVIGRTPITPAARVRALVSEARTAHATWSRVALRDRARHLLLARTFLLEHLEEIAHTITIDNGKPLTESIASELAPVAELLWVFAHRAQKLLREEALPIGIMRWLLRRSTLTYRPIGVVGIISPWNYPFSIAAGQVALALLAGNTVLLKPSSATAQVGRAVASIFEAAELPSGVFTHVPGDAATGRALIESRVDKIAFTGSVATGREVMRDCAERLIPLSLELGGKDPMIVRADADLDHAVSGAIWGAFTNAGQCCASVERCYVHESLFDHFVELATRRALQLKVGNGLDPDVCIGPLTTSAQLEHVEAHVLDAKARGATVHCGGERLRDRIGYFFPPTILTEVDHSFACVRDETFGPLLPIMSFRDDTQAIQLANDSSYGLTASIWSRDLTAAKRMARELQTGTVTINDCVYTHALPLTPWGGMKQSGFGRSHGKLGLLDFAQPVHLHANPLTRKNPWWFPYDLSLFQDFMRFARSCSATSIRKLTTLPLLVRLFRRTKI